MEIVDDKKYILVTLEYDEDEDGKYEEMSGRKIKAYFHDLAEQRFWDGEAGGKDFQDNDEYVLFLLHVIKGESAAVLEMVKIWSFALIEKDPAVEGVADYQRNRNELINNRGYDADVVDAMSEKEVQLRVWLYEAAPSFANVTQVNQEMAICLGGMDDAVDYLLAHPHAVNNTYYDDVEDTGHYYLDIKLYREGNFMQIENDKSYILIDLEHQEQPETNYKMLSGSDIIAFFKGLADKRLEQSFKSDFPDNDEVLLWLVHASRGEEDAIRALLDVNEWLYAIIEKNPATPGVNTYIENRKRLKSDTYDETELNDMSEMLVYLNCYLLDEVPCVDLELRDLLNGAVSLDNTREAALYLEAHPEDLERVFFDNERADFFLVPSEALAADKAGLPESILPSGTVQKEKTYSIRELEEILQLQGINLAHFAALAGKHGWNDADYCDFVRAVYKSDTFNEAWEKDAIADPSKFVVKSDMYRNTELILKAVREVVDKGV